MFRSPRFARLAASAPMYNAAPTTARPPRTVCRHRWGPLPRVKGATRPGTAVCFWLRLPIAGGWAERVNETCGPMPGTEPSRLSRSRHTEFLVDLVSRARVRIIDLLLQPSDAILDTTPHLGGTTAEVVLLGSEHGRHTVIGARVEPPAPEYRRPLAALWVG